MNSSVVRIIAAAVMIILVIVLALMGKWALLLLTALVGLLLVDEVICNFMREKRFAIKHVINILVFIIPFILFNFFYKMFAIHILFVYFAFFINLGIIYYLFAIPMQNERGPKVLRKVSFLIGIFFLIQMMSISTIFHMTENWGKLLALFFLVNFGMDSGGWIFGKLFGKHKLWPSVSPNKTIEGVIGGGFLSGILGNLFWIQFIGTPRLSLFVLLPLLGLVSHLGDLFQSKIKRQVGIKNSSLLIPGHGGVYDRVDSLLMLGPFFVLIMRVF